MRRPRSRSAALALVVVAGLVAGCGDDGGGEDRTGVDQLEADLPDEVLGLRLAREDLADALADKNASYVEAVGLFSLREGDLLQATLQVSRFGEDARPEEGSFRRSIVNQLGSSQPRPYQMGDQTVFLTTGSSQRVSVWFADDLFYILGVRDDFGRGRSLLRQLLEVTSS